MASGKKKTNNQKASLASEEAQSKADTPCSCGARTEKEQKLLVGRVLTLHPVFEIKKAKAQAIF